MVSGFLGSSPTYNITQVPQNCCRIIDTLGPFFRAKFGLEVVIGREAKQTRAYMADQKAYMADQKAYIGDRGFGTFRIAPETITLRLMVGMCCNWL